MINRMNTKYKTPGSKYPYTFDRFSDQKKNNSILGPCYLTGRFRPSFSAAAFDRYSKAFSSLMALEHQRFITICFKLTGW